MKIRFNEVEDWGVRYEYTSKYNLGETCVDSISINQFCALAGLDADKILKDFASVPLTYGDLSGRPALLKGIASLHRTVTPEDIFTAHGASGANQLVFSSLVDRGTHVVTIMPTYSQLYAFPECFGGDVSILHLKQEEDFLPNLDELKKLVRKDTKLIVINNPHNPSGNLLPLPLLQDIVKIAAEVGAYLLCDETYRYLTQEDVYTESIVDLYDKGISVSSMTKVFSLAGLRLGWVVAKDPELKKALKNFREYFMISGSIFDEYFGGIVLEHKDLLIERNRGIIRENLEVVADWIEKQPHIRMPMKPKAATATMVYHDYDVPSRTMCREMYEKERIFIYPGEAFELGTDSIRLSYACGKEELVGGLAAVTRFLENAAYPLKSR